MAPPCEPHTGHTPEGWPPWNLALLRGSCVEHDLGGRGLALVRALVDEFSVAMSGEGKDVWFFIADPEHHVPQTAEPTES